MKNKPFFYDTIRPLTENHKLQGSLSYHQWLDSFLEKEQEKYLL